MHDVIPSRDYFHWGVKHVVSSYLKCKKKVYISLQKYARGLQNWNLYFCLVGENEKELLTVCHRRRERVKKGNLMG